MSLFIAPPLGLTRALRAAARIGWSAMVLSTLALSANGSISFSNGNFSTFTNTTNPGVPSQVNDTGGGGYTTLANWTVGPGSSGLLAFLFASGTADTTGSHDVRFNDTFNLWGPGANGGGVANGLTASSPDGGNYLALDAAPAYQGPISQNISGLTVGQYYTVRFYWAAAQQHNFDGATTESVQVGFGAQPTQTTTVFNLASHAFSGWMTKTFDFKADSSVSEKLSFLAIGTPDGFPPFVLLDGITVTATPEPGTATLLLGALGLLCVLGVLRSKKRRRSDCEPSMIENPPDAQVVP